MSDTLTWRDLAPDFAALREQQLSAGDVAEWLQRWSNLLFAVYERRAWLKRARLRDLTDEAAGEAFFRFAEEVVAPAQAASHDLTEKLLAVPDYEPTPQHHEMLRRLRDEASFFHAANQPIQAEISRLAAEYDRLAASVTVRLDGRELSGPERELNMAGPDRAAREELWRAESAAWDEIGGAIADLFIRMVRLRGRLANNAGLPDYRAYRWREMGRLDYTPADAQALDALIAAEIVPLAAELRELRSESLGVETLRPWDLFANPASSAHDRLFPDVASYEEAMAGVFARLDPEFGALFNRMRDGYLDLGWRKGKPSGGEEWLFPASGIPSVRLDREGTRDAVALLLHEMGHAFHDYLALKHQGLFWNLGAPTEFEEFAAITMTFIALPALSSEQGGFYSSAQAAAHRQALLEESVARWLPYIGQVDAFQHWVYTTAPETLTPALLDARWRELGAYYQPWLDWQGLESEQGAGWRRIGILFGSPFYMIEYGLAYLGAFQVWRNSLQDHAAAWQAYRTALTLGNTRPLPELFQAAGARLPFEAGVVAEMAALVSAHIAKRPTEV